MPKLIEIDDHGLFERMRQYPTQYNTVMEKTHQASLLVLHEGVPAYPPKPASSTYIRTGTLGRSLGSSISGGGSGVPEIFQTRSLGPGEFESRFGTRLGYAEFVIGEIGVQSSFFAAYWWRLEGIISAQFNRILGLFQTAADEMAKFLDGK